MVYVTRKCHFSSSHRLLNSSWSEAENKAVFDKCYTLHGHNYYLEVTLAGVPDPATGYVYDLKKLKTLLQQVILDKVDHQHLNDVDFLQGYNPTAEVLAVRFWQVLQPLLPEGLLYEIVLYETENNIVRYRGERTLK